MSRLVLASIVVLIIIAVYVLVKIDIQTIGFHVHSVLTKPLGPRPVKKTLALVRQRLSPAMRDERRRYYSAYLEDILPVIEDAARATKLLPGFEFPQIRAKYEEILRTGGPYPSFKTLIRLDRLNTPTSSLIEWEDKRLFYEKLDGLGIPHPEVYYCGTPDRQTLLDTLALHPRFVIKPTHLNGSTCVIVYDNGVNLKNNKKMSLDRVTSTALKTLQMRQTGGTQALDSVTPRILVEEAIDRALDVKFMTVWGKVFICKILNQSIKLRTLGLLTRDGELVPHWGNDLDRRLDERFVRRYKDMVAMVEKVARGTDLLRVDILYGKDGRVCVGEVEISSGATLDSCGQKALIDAYMEGISARMEQKNSERGAEENRPGSRQ